MSGILFPIMVVLTSAQVVSPATPAFDPSKPSIGFECNAQSDSHVAIHYFFLLYFNDIRASSNTFVKAELREINGAGLRLTNVVLPEGTYQTIVPGPLFHVSATGDDKATGSQFWLSNFFHVDRSVSSSLNAAPQFIGNGTLKITNSQSSISYNGGCKWSRENNLP